MSVFITPACQQPKKSHFLPCFSQLNNSINEALNNVGINPSEYRNK